MTHLDPDLLALLALGERVSTVQDTAHILECPECAEELALLSRAAEAGRASLETRELSIPDPRVYGRILEELGLRPDEAVTPKLARRPPWKIPIAFAASMALILGAAAVLINYSHPPATAVIATATLDALPHWAGASGTAVIQQTAGGAREVHINLRNVPVSPGYREAWLMTADLRNLVSLGVVEDGSGTFNVPEGIDLSNYDVVDISDEPYDGNPQHSGDSVVRGQFRALANVGAISVGPLGVQHVLWIGESTSFTSHISGPIGVVHPANRGIDRNAKVEITHDLPLSAPVFARWRSERNVLEKAGQLSEPG